MHKPPSRAQDGSIRISRSASSLPLRLVGRRTYWRVRPRKNFPMHWVSKW